MAECGNSARSVRSLSQWTLVSGESDLNSFTSFVRITRNWHADGSLELGDVPLDPTGEAYIGSSILAP